MINTTVEFRKRLTRVVRVMIENSYPGTIGGGLLYFAVESLPAVLCDEIPPVPGNATMTFANESIKAIASTRSMVGQVVTLQCDDAYEFVDEPTEITTEPPEKVIDDHKAPYNVDMANTTSREDGPLKWVRCSASLEQGGYPCMQAQNAADTKGWAFSSVLPAWMKVSLQCAENEVHTVEVRCGWDTHHVTEVKITLTNDGGMEIDAQNPATSIGTIDGSTGKISLPAKTKAFNFSFTSETNVQAITVHVYKTDTSNNAVVTGVTVYGRPTTSPVSQGCWGGWEDFPAHSCQSPSRGARRSCSISGACRGDYVTCGEWNTWGSWTECRLGCPSSSTYTRARTCSTGGEACGSENLDEQNCDYTGKSGCCKYQSLQFRY